MLGHDLAAKLFDGRDPIGQTVMLGGLPHRVIGIVAPQGTLFGISLDKFAVTTLTSPVRNLVNRPHVIDDLHIQADNPDQMRAAMEEVTVLMRSRRGLRPSQPDNFHLESAEAALSEWEKISKIAKKVYRASEVTADAKVRAQIKKLQDDGYGRYPVCVAKTQSSFSTDPALRGAPSNHVVNIREVRLAAGAEFVVMICGDIMTMPGLPKVPSAAKIDLVDGKVVGLF